MGGKQLTKRLLLLLLVNMKNNVKTYHLWGSHKPNIGHIRSGTSLRKGRQHSPTTSL